MAQSDARFEYVAKHSREPQHLKKDPFAFTCAAGMLVPIFSDFASPGDTYYIKHDLDFLRTSPMAKPAMIDVKVHYESFFVPMQMIYQPFEQTFFATKDLQSSFYSLGNLQNSNFPLFDYSDYVSKVRATNGSLNFHADAFRFADYMQLNPLNFAGNIIRTSNTYEPNFFPWAVLAYHAIWEYVYRLDDKTQFNNNSFNWDSAYSSTTPIKFDGDSEFFTIYQRPWDFDYFTSMYRSPIVSDVNMQNILPSYQILSDLVDSPSVRIGKSGLNATVNKDITAFSNDPGSSFSGATMQKAFNTAAIRQMFSNEKLAMITGRTRKTYDAQVLAHFGVNVPHDPKHDIAKIGRDTFDLRIGEVTSLASTGTTPLGELAGKGYAYGEGKREHKFTAPCHGVVMTIFSVEPKKKYTGGFARKHAVTTSFDFPVPEYDRLGNQPVYRFEVGNRYVNPSDPNDQTLMNDIIGWNRRYQQWKSQPPYATQAFMGSTPSAVNDYNAYMIASEPFGVIDPSTLGARNGSSRPDLQSRFYIDRHCTDGIMLMKYADGWKNISGGEQWSATPWMVYVRDPFIVNSFEKVSKVSWMSVDGEPIYPY